MDILLATRNTHKIAEIERILHGTGVRVLGLDAWPDLPHDIPETGATFVDNALQKARFVYERTGVLTVADDSGLEVDALGGGPGVHSKRFSPEGTDEANNALLIHLLDGRKDRTARYRCVLGIVGPTGERVAEGRCEGEIATAPRGAGGFGYDPYFLPAEAPGRTMAELTMDEKNAISHRGRAVRQLPAILEELVR